MKVEKKRIKKLKRIHKVITRAKRMIKRQRINIKNSAIAGEGSKYSDRIEILKGAINRLDNRYFKVLNG